MARRPKTSCYTKIKSADHFFTLSDICCQYITIQENVAFLLGGQELHGTLLLIQVLDVHGGVVQLKLQDFPNVQLQFCYNAPV